MDQEGVKFSRVLVVDARPQHQKVIATALSRLLGKTRVAFHAPKATTLPNERFPWSEFDLALIDAGADKEKLKTWYEDLLTKASLPPIVILDLQANVDDAVDLVHLGAADYLDKRHLKEKRLLKALHSAARTPRSPAPVAAAEQLPAEDINAVTGVIQVDQLRKVTAAATPAPAGAAEAPASQAAPRPAPSSQPPQPQQPAAKPQPAQPAAQEKEFMLDSQKKTDSWMLLPQLADDLPFTPLDIQQGTAMVGKYRILEFLGAGGGTLVFKVEHEQTKKVYALKLLTVSESDQVNRERFTREFEAVKSIDHPHIVKVYEHHPEGRWPYTVMEYYALGDLQSVMNMRVPRERAINYAAQIAAGLHGAHKRGLIHRDLKPANVMRRDDGSLVLVDFGIVKNKTADEQALTDEGKMVGTPYYVSPEQAKGGKLDGRSDLYALGVILFEMLEARRPFTGGSPIDVIFAHVQDPIPSLTQDWDELNDFLPKLLAKDREERFATGLDVVKALRELSPTAVPERLLAEAEA